MTYAPHPAGHPVEIEPGVISVLAPNPGPLTHWGTNSYVIPGDACVVIDPGPQNDSHLAALLAVIDGREVSHILVTHAHNDHSPLASDLKAATGAPICAFGTVRAGMSPVMQALEARGHMHSAEGLDHTFVPDILLRDGAPLETGAGIFTVHHTPGHLGNHLCFGWRDILFSGDHVMDWATSIVSPPFGDLTDFMASCEKLQGIPARRYLCGHGIPVETPAERLAELIAHRRMREAQILAALSGGPSDVETLTRTLYADVPKTLWPAASRNVFAHLIDLTQRNMTTSLTPLSVEAIFERL